MKFLARFTLNSLVGVLRNMVTFIPIVKPFMQLLISTQHTVEQPGSPGTPMTDKLRFDLEWWQHLVFRMNSPVFLYQPEVDGWVLLQGTSGISIHCSTPQRIVQFSSSTTTAESELVAAILETMAAWVPVDNNLASWRHIRIHVRSSWEVRLLETMYCLSPEGQHLLRTLALAQTSRRLRLSVTRVLKNHHCDFLCLQDDSTGSPKQQSNSNAQVSIHQRYTRTPRNSSTAFCEAFQFPVWIDELSLESQARIVGLFAGMCALEGHNAQGKRNKYQTFNSKMAAVAFAHKSVWNARLNYKSPEFEHISQSYKRTNSHVDRKQPVTSPMLFEIHRLLQQERSTKNGNQLDLLWCSVVIAFFFLDRSSELWGPATKDNSTGGIDTEAQLDRVAEKPIQSKYCSGLARAIRYIKGTQIRHYKSGQRVICPVTGADTCLNFRKRWKADGRRLGPYPTSISTTTTTKKIDVAKLIKNAARTQGETRTIIRHIPCGLVGPVHY
ncbi:hypothetical protein PHMEG_00021155 [Phytophthora megakarya]|uniref:Uncharacterized protein n=1 Tax=Phytophthora megakarya TaxID=4795 RepID=A0A225VLY4_9STRA|nr:hypothetical protein PHMEG_00021155 [Phytophthora megakarya]